MILHIFHDRRSLEDVAAKLNWRTAMGPSVCGCRGAVFNIPLSRFRGERCIAFEVPGQRPQGKLGLFGWWIENYIIPESALFSVVQQGMMLFFAPP
jgi:hypothetical protein